MINVIHEDNHLIAVNKSSGMLSQGDDTGDVTIMDYVKQYIKLRYDKKGDVFLGSFHRLDRPTSGVLVFARTSKALTRMNEVVKKKKFRKTYYCVTSQRPPQPADRLVHHLVKNQTANFVTVYETPRKFSKEAILSYELVAQIDGKFLLKIDLETGRSHQIRSQLSYIGCPIVGDTKYNGMVHTRGAICLHSSSVSFIHPVKKEPVILKADPPEDRMWQLFRGFLDNN